MSEENVSMQALCASHGVELNAQDDAANLEAVAAIGGGELIKALFAFIVKYGPAAAKIAPQLLALIAAGNWLGAIMLLLSVVSPPTV